MSRSLNLSLTDELRAYIDSQSGPGTTFSTPSEFVRAVLRERKEREEAASIRAAVIEGYEDIRAGRVLEYKGSIRDLIDEAKRLDATGWPKV
jgi:antitoxin ParD1/3/4